MIASQLRRLASRAWRARLRALPVTRFERDAAVAMPHTMLGLARLRSLHDVARKLDARGVAGDIVECGVATGGSALLLGLARRGLAPRTLWLFDTFEGLPEPSASENADYDVVRQFTGKCRGDEHEVVELLRQHAPEQDVRTVRGLFQDTIPTAPVRSIALLHVDGDWYESVHACLTGFWDRCSSGAVVQVDDYGSWAGCRRAVDEFVAARSLSIDPVDATAVRLHVP